jgi:hypothetical protein
MSPESWLKISLPAFPVAFAIIGVGLYWQDNIVALLPPSIAFWGLVTLMYLFSQLEVPGKRYTHILIMFVTCLWLVSSITSHNLGKFIASAKYSGVASLLSDKDLWFAYGCAVVGSLFGVFHFVRLEPLIVSQTERDRASSGEKKG